MEEERPHDAAWFLDQCLLTLAGLAGLALIAAAAVLVLSLGKEEPPAAEPPPPPHRLVLSHPLGCDFTMVVTVGGYRTQRPTCYVRPVEVWL